MSKSKISPAYLMYPDDILSSGRIAALEPLEELWFRRALDHGWQSGGMPADAEEFAGWVGRGCTTNAAEKIIRKFYVPHKKDATKVVNPRQEKERANFLKKIKQKSEAGKRGMANRWGKRDNVDNSVITEDNIPIPIPIPNKEEINNNVDKENNVDCAPLSAGASIAKKSNKGTRITEPFLLTAVMREWAATKYPRVDVMEETAAFVDHFKQATGQKATSLDWVLRWKNWIRRVKGNGNINHRQERNRAVIDERNRIEQIRRELDGTN